MQPTGRRPPRSPYLTPDVTADFSWVQVAEAGRDRVRLQRVSGRERPRTLKVTVGFEGGFLGEAGVSYAGPNAARRARLARDILRADRSLCRLCRQAQDRHHRPGSLHVTALGAEAEGKAEPGDVRVHAVLRSTDRADAETMLREVESCCAAARLEAAAIADRSVRAWSRIRR